MRVHSKAVLPAQGVTEKLSGQQNVTMKEGGVLSDGKTEGSGYEFTQPCPIRDVLDRIGDQWSLLILEALEVRTLRFNELSREIGDISKQMLSRTLKRLEQDGFILRTIYPEVPPRVVYQLTELGRSFLVPMQKLVIWADANHRAVCEARERYVSKKVAW